MAKKILNENKKEELRNELDDLMKGFSDTFKQEPVGHAKVSDVIGQNLDSLSKPAKIYNLDLEKMDIDFKIKSKQILTSMFDFYLDAGVLNVHEYSMRKRELDTCNLANMLWQLKTVKVTISILMDEITSGNVHPRVIEALGTMQDKFSDIMRMQANYMLFLEDTYKKMKYENTGRIGEGNENTEASKVISSSVDSDTEFYLSADTKMLIDTLEKTSAGETYEHPEITGRFTDPTNKDELAKEFNVEIVKKADVEEYGSILDMI